MPAEAAPQVATMTASPLTSAVVAPAFTRNMKLFGALLITLSSVTPASSIFIVVPGVVEQAGTGALIAFAGAAFISLLTAYVYAELASAFPLTGGEYAIVGRTLGPLAGFIILGVNLVVLLLNISVVALGLGQYVSAILPHTSPVIDGLVCVIFTTLCAILNVRTNALITGAFLVLELIALLAVTILGFLYPARPWLDVLAHPVHLDLAGKLTATPVGVIGLATSVAIFAFYGYGNAVYLGEETHDAPRHIARAVLWALVISVISQALPLAAMLHGGQDLATLFASDTMFGDFVAQRGGHALGIAINLSVALAIINADIAVVVLVSRMLFSSGRDCVWATPVNRILTLVHPTLGSPWAADPRHRRARLPALLREPQPAPRRHRHRDRRRLRRPLHRRHRRPPERRHQPRLLPHALLSLAADPRPSGTRVRRLRQPARPKSRPAQPSRHRRHDRRFGAVLPPRPSPARSLGFMRTGC